MSSLTQRQDTSPSPSVLRRSSNPGRQATRDMLKENLSACDYGQYLTINSRGESFALTFLTLYGVSRVTCTMLFSLKCSGVRDGKPYSMVTVSSLGWIGRSEGSNPIRSGSYRDTQGRGSETYMLATKLDFPNSRYMKHRKKCCLEPEKCQIWAKKLLVVYHLKELTLSFHFRNWTFSTQVMSSKMNL